MLTYFNPAKHLYGRGWLGLIPLVGGFVGIGLIILGVFKYRDRKLTLIGIAALMFTVSLYGSMFYYFNYSEQARKDYAHLSQELETSLIANIEFYKSQKGHYPARLEELLSIDKFAEIHDPILFGKNCPNDRKYYYTTIGDKYTLFSAGVDKIPNTADDIFPLMINLDSTKIGYIRLRQ